jgi:DNA invertase Pin-like site-specific DNA recombinase
MDDNRITAYTFTRMQPQATNADLLTAQREMDAYCKNSGYRIVGSAFTKEPSEKMSAVMQDILTDMKSKNVELLIIPDISRLGRNTATVVDIVKAFAVEGIDIEITADGSRPTEPFAPDAEPFIQEM